jgi:ribose transport system substrate-binding protein
VRKRGHIVLLALIAALAAFSVVGAANARPTAGERVIFVGADIGDPFYQSMRCGAVAAAKKHRIKFTWTGTTGVDFADELKIFNASVQRKPTGLITAPFSPDAFIQPVQKAMKSGIPVVTVDGSLSRRVELQNIRTDNLAAGAIAGQNMGRLLRGKGNVAVISFSPDVPVQRDRVNGFKQALAKRYPGVKVVAVEYGGADTGKAAQVAGAILQRHPDLAGFYGTDTNDAEGAGSAILAAGQRGKVKLIGYDSGPKAIAGLKTGLYDGLVGQSPYQIGFKSVETLANYFNGKAKKPPYQVKTGAGWVDKSNLNKPSVQQYIYKKSC